MKKKKYVFPSCLANFISYSFKRERKNVDDWNWRSFLSLFLLIFSECKQEFAWFSVSFRCITLTNTQLSYLHSELVEQRAIQTDFFLFLSLACLLSLPLFLLSLLVVELLLLSFIVRQIVHTFISSVKMDAHIRLLSACKIIWKYVPFCVLLRVLSFGLALTLFRSPCFTFYLSLVNASLSS